MKFVVRCIDDYVTDQDELVFEEGKNYTLFINYDGEARVLYDETEGTLFLSGSLERHFEPYMY